MPHSGVQELDGLRIVMAQALLQIHHSQTDYQDNYLPLSINVAS